MSINDHHVLWNQYLLCGCNTWRKTYFLASCDLLATHKLGLQDVGLLNF